MRAARRLLDTRGMLLVYENASPNGEDREGWLRRWDLQEPDWTGLTPADWGRMAAHVRTYDFPETVSRWWELGHEADSGRCRNSLLRPRTCFACSRFGLRQAGNAIPHAGAGQRLWERDDGAGRLRRAGPPLCRRALRRVRRKQMLRET